MKIDEANTCTLIGIKVMPARSYFVTSASCKMSDDWALIFKAVANLKKARRLVYLDVRI